MIKTLGSNIVGIQYYSGSREILVSLPLETELAIVREPDNEHDANACAVKVEQGGAMQMLGYIPRAQAVFVAELVDTGRFIKAIYRGGGALTIEYEDARGAPQPQEA